MLILGFLICIQKVAGSIPVTSTIFLQSLEFLNDPEPSIFQEFSFSHKAAL